MLISHYASPLGAITLAGEDDALTGLWFAAQRHYGSNLPAKDGSRFSTTPSVGWTAISVDTSLP